VKRYETRQAELLAVVQPFVDRASALISDRVDDALAHAEKALTRATIDEPNGRATIRRVDWSPSYNAALSRLAELVERLAGPSVASQKGIVRQAWEEAYRDCHRHWNQVLDPAIRDAYRDYPDHKEIVRARTITVLGYDARSFLLGPADVAGRMLKATIVQVAVVSTPEAERANRLESWAKRTTTALQSRTAQLIRTGAFYLDRVAGRDVVRPELLHDDPTIQG